MSRLRHYNTKNKKYSRLAFPSIADSRTIVFIADWDLGLRPNHVHARPGFTEEEKIIFKTVKSNDR